MTKFPDGVSAVVVAVARHWSENLVRRLAGFGAMMAVCDAFKIQNDVRIYDGVRLEDEALSGSSRGIGWVIRAGACPGDDVVRPTGGTRHRETGERLSEEIAS